MKVRVHIWHVRWRSRDKLPGRDREIQRTDEVRREMPKFPWWDAHFRTESRRVSERIHSFISGGR